MFRCFLVAMALTLVGCWQRSAEVQTDNQPADSGPHASDEQDPASQHKGPYTTLIEEELAEDPLEYWIVLANDSGDGSYDDDSTLRYGDGSYLGTLVTYVNGTPVKLRTAGGEAWRINEFMEDGENVITFSGDTSRKFFAKVITLYRSQFKPPDWAFQEVIAKTRFRLTDEEPPELRFDADLAHVGIYEVLQDDQKSREKQRVELRELCLRYAAAIRNHDFSEVEKLTGMSLPITRFGTTEVEVNSAREEMRKLVEDTGFELLTDPALVKFIFGRKGVFVYSNIDEPQHIPFLFRLEKESTLQFEKVSTLTEVVRIQPLVFVKRDGRWALP